MLPLRTRARAMSVELSEAAQRVARALEICQCGHQWTLHRVEGESHPHTAAFGAATGCYAPRVLEQRLAAHIVATATTPSRGEDYCICRARKPRDG